MEPFSTSSRFLGQGASAADSSSPAAKGCYAHWSQPPTDLIPASRAAAPGWPTPTCSRPAQAQPEVFFTSGLLSSGSSPEKERPSPPPGPASHRSGGRGAPASAASQQQPPPLPRQEEEEAAPPLALGWDLANARLVARVRELEAALAAAEQPAPAAGTPDADPEEVRLITARLAARQREVAALQQALEGREREVAARERELEQAREREGDLLDEAARWKDEHAKAEKEAKALRQKLEAATCHTGLLDAGTTQLRRQLSELGRSSGEKEVAVRQLEDELRALQESEAAKERQLARLHEEHGAAGRENAALREQATELQGEVARLRGALHASRERAAELHSRCRALERAALEEVTAAAAAGSPSPSAGSGRALQRMLPRQPAGPGGLSRGPQHSPLRMDAREAPWEANAGPYAEGAGVPPPPLGRWSAAAEAQQAHAEAAPLPLPQGEPRPGSGAPWLQRPHTAAAAAAGRSWAPYDNQPGYVPERGWGGPMASRLIPDEPQAGALNPRVGLLKPYSKSLEQQGRLGGSQWGGEGEPGLLPAQLLELEWQGLQARAGPPASSSRPPGSCYAGSTGGWEDAETSSIDGSAQVSRHPQQQRGLAAAAVRPGSSEGSADERGQQAAAAGRLSSQLAGVGLQQAQRRSPGAPFGTDDSVLDFMARSEALEAHLLALNSEKNELDAEYARMPGHTAGRTMQERKRRGEVEQRLEAVNREASGIRLQLRRLGGK